MKIGFRQILIFFIPVIFFNCVNILNSENIINNLKGEYLLYGARSLDMFLFSKEESKSDIIINFYENNIAKITVIENDVYYSENYLEYELNNGQYRDRIIKINNKTEYEPIEEWNEWVNFTLNDEIFEFESKPNSDIYIVYKRK
jgi:hypothetical protein